MNKKPQTGTEQQVEPLRPWRFNSIWLVPVLALIIAGWMVYQNWAAQGPEITLVAADAEGLEVGKTKVKAHNVDVGEVTDIHLSDNYEQAIIKVRMNNDAEQMLHEDAKFWVIKPRIGKEGVSGLGTLLSGAYIGMEPGAEGNLVHHFDMLEQPPLSTSEDKGIRIRLSSRDNSKMDVGTPVHFRGYEVGYIEQVGFDVANSAITYRIFIQAPYDKLVNSAVQFWITPGFSFKSSARGVEVRLDSFETLLSGGISFGEIQTDSVTHPVADLTQFRLYSSRDEAINNGYTQYLSYVFLFDSNISGLEVGAPVEFRGVRVGTVKQVPYITDHNNVDQWQTLKDHAIPVLARIEPQRLDADFKTPERELDKWRQLFSNDIKDGLRASLRTSNYLTGAKVINLDFVPHPKSVSRQQYGGFPTFPTSSGGFDRLEQKLGQVLDKISAVPLNEVFTSFNGTLKSADKTMQSLRQMSDTLHQLLKTPSAQQLPVEFNDVLQQLDKTLASYQRGGEIGSEVTDNLRSLQRSLDDLQSVLQRLRQQPNALIFDSNVPADRQPQAVKKEVTHE